MAVTHHESAVLYPVRIRVILASIFLFIFFLLHLSRIIADESRTPLLVIGSRFDYCHSAQGRFCPRERTKSS